MRGRYYRLILSLCAKEQYDHTSLILSCYNTTLIDLRRYNIKENDFLFLLPGTYIQSIYTGNSFCYETVPTIDFLYKEKPIAFFLAKFYVYSVVLSHLTAHLTFTIIFLISFIFIRHKHLAKSLLFYSYSSTLCHDGQISRFYCILFTVPLKLMSSFNWQENLYM